MKMASAMPRMSEPAARMAEDHSDAAERHGARQHGSQMRDFAEPYPGERGGEEGTRRDDDGDVGYAGQLQGRDEREHGQRRKRRDQPAASSHPGQLPQAGAALQQHHHGRDQSAAEQPAPEQDGPGIIGKQPREERRRAPGDGGRDDEGNAEAMLGRGAGHLRCALAHIKSARASPHWRCVRARRTPCGRLPRARRRLRGSAHARGWQSTGATGCRHRPCRSTIPVPGLMATPAASAA